ncbi:hypothetical protein QTP88_005840 [Uroleucon formosanum]
MLMSHKTSRLSDLLFKIYLGRPNALSMLRLMHQLMTNYTKHSKALDKSLDRGEVEKNKSGIMTILLTLIIRDNHYSFFCDLVYNNAMHYHLPHVVICPYKL